MFSYPVLGFRLRVPLYICAVFCVFLFFVFSCRLIWNIIFIVLLCVYFGYLFLSLRKEKHPSENQIRIMYCETYTSFLFCVLMPILHASVSFIRLLKGTWLQRPATFPICGRSCALSMKLVWSTFHLNLQAVCSPFFKINTLTIQKGWGGIRYRFSNPHLKAYSFKTST